MMCNVIVIVMWAFATQARAKDLVVNFTDNAQDAVDKQVDKLASKLVERVLEPLHHTHLENTTFAKTSSKSWSTYAKMYRGTKSPFPQPARTVSVPSGDLHRLRLSTEYHQRHNIIMHSNTFGNAGNTERLDRRSKPTVKAAVQDKVQERPMPVPETRVQDTKKMIKSLEATVQEEKVDTLIKTMTSKNEKMEKTIQSLQKQAPLLTDSSLLSTNVRYSCPLEYQYLPKLGSVNAEGAFSGVFHKYSFADFMKEVQDRLEKINRLDKYSVKVIRSFRPEPNVLTCMWEVSFRRGAHRATVVGSSTYSMDEDGKVSSIQETWQTKSDSDVDRNRVAELFLDSLAFQLSRRPPKVFEYSPAGFVPGYKYASWEALKSDSTGSTREQADQSSMQILNAFMGVSGGLYVGSMYALAQTLQSMFEAASLSPP
jgi:hypothetical protein